MPTRQSKRGERGAPRGSLIAAVTQPRRSSRTASADQEWKFSSCCIPSGVASPASSASVRLFLLSVPENKTVKNRVHVCLQPGDRDRDAEVDRLLALGANISDDYRTSDGDGWVVLLDPAGNEFCMTRSAAERQY
jgi:hypothetical protein